MSESPNNDGPETKSKIHAPEVNPIARLVSRNGGTIESAYAAYLKFMSEGTEDDEEAQEEKKRARAERKRARQQRKSGVKSEANQEQSECEPNREQVISQGAEKGANEPKPKMHALDPALPHFEAWVATFPWKAGMQPGALPTWRHIAPEHTQEVIEEERVTILHRLEQLLRVAALF